MMMSRTLGAMRSSLVGTVASLLVIGALPGSMYARAQITSTTVTEVPLADITPVAPIVSITTTTVAPATTTASYGTMTVQCWRTTMLGGSSARFEVDTAAASTVSGAVCWEVFPLNGGTVSIPVTPGPDFQPLSLQSSLSAAAAATAAGDSVASSTESPSSSSSNLAKILPAALIGSLVGVMLLIFTVVYILRLRQRRRTQDSRAKRWVERNSAALRESWAMKETPAGFNHGTNVGKVETA